MLYCIRTSHWQVLFPCIASTPVFLLLTTLWWRSTYFWKGENIWWQNWVSAEVFIRWTKLRTNPHNLFFCFWSFSSCIGTAPAPSQSRLMTILLWACFWKGIGGVLPSYHHQVLFRSHDHWGSLCILSRSLLLKVLCHKCCCELGLCK